MKKWFYFDINDPNMGSVCIRNLCLQDLKNTALTTLGKSKGEKMLAKLHLIVVAWRNIQIDGVEVQCNTVNKDKLLHNQKFLDFVSDCMGYMVKYEN